MLRYNQMFEAAVLGLGSDPEDDPKAKLPRKDYAASAMGPVTWTSEPLTMMENDGVPLNRESNHTAHRRISCPESILMRNPDFSNTICRQKKRRT